MTRLNYPSFPTTPVVPDVTVPTHMDLPDDVPRGTLALVEETGKVWQKGLTWLKLAHLVPARSGASGSIPGAGS